MPNRISNIEPHKIDETGIVTFTDGVSTGLVPNQRVCEAYGYTYDTFSGTCRINQVFVASLDSEFDNQSNKINGVRNNIGNTTKNITVNGDINTVLGKTKNALLNGEGHLIDTDISNCTVLGQKGNVTRQNEFLIGGGLNDLTTGISDDATVLSTQRQMSILHLSGVTTNNSAKKLTINGDNLSFINVKANTILGYEIYITRLELGGTSGTAGNFSYRNLKGCVRISHDYSMTFTTAFTRNIAKLGVNGTTQMVDSSTSDVKSITVQCSDRNNIKNAWSAVVYLHEIVSLDTNFTDE